MTREVLVVGQSGGNKRIYHDVDGDDADRSECGIVTPDDNSRLYDVSRLPDRYRYCRYCDDDWDVPTSNPGTKLATKLKAIGEARTSGERA